MDKKLLFKMLAIGLMAFLLLIPLLMVEGQIRDRAQRQREVQDNIANSSAGEQVLAGPVLVVHYRETVEVPAESEKTGPRRQVLDRTLLLPPSKLNLDGEAGVETRQRGIYQARLCRRQPTAAAISTGSMQSACVARSSTSPASAGCAPTPIYGRPSSLPRRTIWPPTGSPSGNWPATRRQRSCSAMSRSPRSTPSIPMRVRLSPVAPVAGHQPICYGQQEKTAKNQICPTPSTPAQFDGMPARL